MKKTILLCLALATSMLGMAKEQEKEAKSTIKEVTVFIQGAQIKRNSSVSLLAGKTNVIFKGLSPYIDKKSIQVSGDGQFTIMSVNHELNYLDDPTDSEEVKALEAKVKALDEKIIKEQTLQKILQEQETFLVANRAFGGKQEAIDPQAFSAMIQIYGNQISKIRLDLLDKQKIINDLNEDKGKLNMELNQLRGQKKETTSEIVVTVNAKAALIAKIDLSYLVDYAGWYPTYDIRVDKIDKPVDMVYKANVHQNTGVDWKNVKLKFSNASPQQSGSLPQLSPYYLTYFTPSYSNYGRTTNSSYSYTAPISGSSGGGTIRGRVYDAQTREGIPFANIVVKDRTIGTVTDLDGNFSLNVPAGSQYLVINYIGYEPQQVAIGNIAQGQVRQMDVALSQSALTLDAVEVQAYRESSSSALFGSGRKAKAPSMAPPPAPKTIPVTTQTIKNQVSIEFEIETPYDITSDGKVTVIDMKNLALPADFEYQCVPKLDNEAFLIAQVRDWEDYDLLDGEVNLYFENTFIGKSVLDVSNMTDTLEISLGRDKSVFVSREKVKDVSGKKLIGGQRVVTKAWEISIRNNKKQDIDIVVIDQIPLSQVKEIEVDRQELSGGKLEESTGEVRWELKVTAGSTEKKKLRYAVKYPKDKQVVVQ